MKGNSPKLDLVNVDEYCQFILIILSRNEILASIKGRNVVNVDVHTKSGQILSIHSVDSF